MTKDKVFLFLDAYQTLCEYHRLHLAVDLDALTVEESPAHGMEEEIGDLVEHIASHLEPTNA